ncbi:MAG: hypothetical protein HZA54_03170 [Planctomycetes bacterium]|nr:hypothetical protein [Planctomycetota bacterium]
MIPQPVWEALREALASVADAGTECALIGGYAVATWGVPRATFDVDLLLPLEPGRLRAFFRACEARGFDIPEEYRAGWQDRIRDMPLVKVKLFQAGRAITVDVFPVTTEFQRSAFARRQTVALQELDRTVSIVTAADLILFKLLADRPKDRVDVQNVLAVQGVPDEAYLRQWAERLGLRDRLDRALSEAGV